MLSEGTATGVPRPAGCRSWSCRERPFKWRGHLLRRNQNRVELSPEAPAFRHKHPGEEITYVLEGSVEYSIDGQALATYNAGDALMVPPETVHSVRTVGSGGAALLATYVVEKGKPLLMVVD